MRKYCFKIHKEGKGFWTECIELPGCVTQGESKEELVNNVQEAIIMYLNDLRKLNDLNLFSIKNVKISQSSIEIAVDSVSK